MKRPLAQSYRAERGQAQSVLQTAQPAERLLFGRHDKSTGLAESGLSPEGTAMRAGLTGPHIAQRAGSGAAQRSARTPIHSPDTDMKITLIAASLAFATAAQAADMNINTLSGEEKAAGWQLLFDGKSLDNWRASDAPGSFSVKDGAIIVQGPRSHLFYVGPVQQHDFKNFEFKADVMTFAKANSGVYFHTKWQEVGWPNLGYEVQVNNSHSDPSRTGGLWGVQDFPKVIAPDGQWFTLTIRVDGKHVTTFVGSEKTADYTEESPIVRKKGLEQRYLASGTFALQGHDPESTVHFRNIRVRPLP